MEWGYSAALCSNSSSQLRAELENRKSELDSREVTLNERTKNVEDHLASELQRVQELTTSMTGLAPPGEISNLSFDWYNPDFKSHPNQFLAFLTMVENWVSGIKTKTYLQKDSNVTDIKVSHCEGRSGCASGAGLNAQALFFATLF